MNFLPSACERKRSVASQLKHLIPIGLIGILGSIGSASAETFSNITTEFVLRDAINAASTNSESDVIDLGGNTISLSSQLEVTAEPGNDLVFLNGTLQERSSTTRIRLVKITGSDSSTVTFNNMELNGGSFFTTDVPADEAGGAAIFSDGVNIEITNSIFSDNMVIGDSTGGAIFLRDASIFAERATFERNSALPGFDNGTFGESSGGAFGSERAGDVIFNNSTFVANFATRGGAIASLNHQNETLITNSTFTSNESSLGGAIWSRGQLSVQTSTFFENDSQTGGGALYVQPLSASDTTTLTRNTFVGNTSNTRASTLLFESRLNSPVVQGNIFVGMDTSDSDNCGEIFEGSPTGTSAEFQNGSFNISDDPSCGDAVQIANASSLFTTASPEDNGGTTETIALNPAVNFAIDKIDDTLLCPSDAKDQRGESVVGNCDIGSYEVIGVDTDGDGLADSGDNCPTIPNENQEDFDQDGNGDVCDNDDDNDGVVDADDAFPLDNRETVDTDGDGTGNNADTDDDNDGTPDVTDAFPLNPDESVDTDGDGTGNNGDFDDDNDGQLDADELECGSDPLDASSLSVDADGDGVPDCLDDDVVTDVHPVTVYQHVNYRGHSLSVDVGDLTFQEIRHSAVGNDRISSIEIASGYQVLACQHARFRGRCETFTNDTSDLRRIGFNDVISSIRVSLAPPVSVYQHVNYRGNSLSVDVGDLTFQEIRSSSVGNDRISSIRIAPGYKVIACQHARFRGRCETFTNDTSDLRTIGFNDVISSLRVRTH